MFAGSRSDALNRHFIAFRSLSVFRLSFLLLTAAAAGADEFFVRF